jgi:RHS repeat-associated protein
VNSETGAYSKTVMDARERSFGPPLAFTRTYDSVMAQEEAVARQPGPLGYGWTDNWDMSLAFNQPVPNDVYRMAGSSSGTSGSSGNGGAAGSALLDNPGSVAVDASGNVYIADSANNRVQEVSASTHTQWGTSMTAGDVYTVVGSASGTSGSSGNGGAATSALLDDPVGVTVDTDGNLYVADSGNNRVQEVAATGRTQWGISMTAADVYTVAGSSTGAAGDSGDGGAATSALLDGPAGLALGAGGDLYIADAVNNRVQEVAAAGGTQWGAVMAANDIYTVAGSATGSAGYSGDAGPATSARLDNPMGVALDTDGNLYVADAANNRVQEVANTTDQQWAQWTTANDIYTIAGSATGSSGHSGNYVAASDALLDGPEGVAIDAAGNLLIADSGNSRVVEVPSDFEELWGHSIPENLIYTVAGSLAGSSGLSGNGSAATGGLFATAAGLALDPSGNLYIADETNNEVREITAQVASGFAAYPTAGGITVTQAGGAQVSFVPPVSGACVAPYVGSGASGTYCALPSVTASLSYNSGASTYTFVTHPYHSYTFNSSGQLIGETTPGGASVSLAYNSPAPGSGRCPSGADSCFTVTGASGRALVIARNSAGEITRVTDDLGRTTTYAYCSPPSGTCSAGDLVSVTNPLTTVTSYTYDEGNANSALVHDLLTVTRPNGQPGGPDAGDKLSNTYNSAGQVSTQTDPNANETTFDYSNLDPGTGDGYTLVTDPDGNTTQYRFDSGILAAKTEGYGSGSPSTWTYVLDPSTLLVDAVIDPNGNMTTYVHDADGNVTSMTNPLGSTWTSSYNVFDEATCVTLPLSSSACASLSPPSAITAGGTVSSPGSAPPKYASYALYDTAGNRVWTTTGEYAPGSGTATQSQTSYALYNGESVTLGSSLSCTTSAPSAALPCATINADRVVTQRGYDSAGDLTSSSTLDGNTGGELAKTTYSYNDDGERTSVVVPKGNLSGATAANFTTTMTYTDGGQLATRTVSHTGGSITARETQYGYDPNGNLTSVENARSKTTTYTYDADDQLTLAEDPDSQQTLTCYDGDGNVAQTVPPVGVATLSPAPSLASNFDCPTSYPAGYGATHRVTAYATAYTYDALGDKTVVTTPAPAGLSGHETTTNTYDAAGRLTDTLAPPASTADGDPAQDTSYGYDDANELLTVTKQGSDDSAVSITSNCYDPNGNKTATVAPDGNTSSVAACSGSSPYQTSSDYQTGYTYDSLGQLVSKTTPTTDFVTDPTTSYSYDPAGNELTSDDPNDVTTTNTYTPLNQLASTDYSDSTASVSYVYDANGNRVSMDDGTGTSTYVYDVFDELSSYENGAGKTVAYSYNADGKTTGITYPLGTDATWATTDTVNYGYDNADELNSVEDFIGNTITIGNTADGLPNSLSLASSGDTLTTTYDPTDTPSDITLTDATPTTLQEFAYSDEPSGAISTETDTPSGGSTYSYDAQSRVLSTSDPDASYDYDASGNLTTLPDASTATYGNASELTGSSVSGTAYGYDADGNRTSQSACGGGDFCDRAYNMTADYNSAHELTDYWSNSAPSEMTTASYDGDGLRQSETSYDWTTDTTENFTWDVNSALPRLLLDSDNAYIYGPRNTPIEQVDISTGTIQYLVSDRIGSVRGIVSSTGTLTDTTSYDAWGNPQTMGGLTTYTPIGYAGAYTDPTGLLYLVRRYYDPTTGQFLTVDPLVDQTHAPYAYAFGDPVNLTDPLGLGAGQEVYNFFAGVADEQTNDLTKNYRKALGEDTVNYCSELYDAGRFVAQLYGALDDLE